MNYKNIKTSINNQLLEIYINRPDKLNAINPETSMELKHIFEQFKSNDKYKVAILGPNTLSAYLQSLHMGFQTLKVQKHATEIYDHLRNISTRFSKHFDNVLILRKKLEEAGIIVKIGKGKGQLNDGQVFGCEFYPAMEIKEEVDANLFLGQSNFHAAGVAISTKVKTYILDPYFNEVRDVTNFAEKLEKKATLKIYKAMEAKVFGVIVGLKEGQFAKVTALKFKKELEEQGKEVQLLALTDITSDRLKNFTGIDAFIQVACPRISTDNEFDKPMLSTPQGNALLKMLKNEKLDNYLEIPHWL